MLQLGSVFTNKSKTQGGAVPTKGALVPAPRGTVLAVADLLGRLHGPGADLGNCLKPRASHGVMLCP